MMSRYDVMVKMSGYKAVTVEAESISEAEELALEEIQDGDGEFNAIVTDISLVEDDEPTDEEVDNLEKEDDLDLNEDDEDEVEEVETNDEVEYEEEA